MKRHLLSLEVDARSNGLKGEAMRRREGDGTFAVARTQPRACVSVCVRAHTHTRKRRCPRRKLCSNPPSPPLLPSLPLPSSLLLTLSVRPTVRLPNPPPRRARPPLQALLPMFNVFLILFLLISIGEARLQTATRSRAPPHHPQPRPAPPPCMPLTRPPLRVSVACTSFVPPPPPPRALCRPAGAPPPPHPPPCGVRARTVSGTEGPGEVCAYWFSRCEKQRG